MAEEIREQEKGQHVKKPVAAFLKVILGMVFLVSGILAILAWRQDLLSLIRGCAGPFLIMSALVTFVIAKE